MPPVAPMLAKSVKEIPAGPMSYEPKWDGFRSIIFRDGDEVEIGSRNERPMTRYFPELVEALLANLPDRCVIDGEIVIPDADDRKLDFEALLQRIHPADSRVRLLAAQTPASFVAFDLLALGDDDCTRLPFERRRAMLEAALGQGGSRRSISRRRPGTGTRRSAGSASSRALAWTVWWPSPWQARYQPDKRVMFKIKHERTADCVVAGYRVHKSGPDAIGSLLLGLYDDAGRLASVGVVGAFPMAMRRQLFAEVQPLVTSFDGHPWNWGGEQPREGVRHPREAEGSRWNAGKDLSFVPLRPERVAEVRYEHMEGTRFRHTAQWIRWRDDRDPASCGFGQLEEPVKFNLAEILPPG